LQRDADRQRQAITAAQAAHQASNAGPNEQAMPLIAVDSPSTVVKAEASNSR
jgi:hypothetical protein